MGQEQTDRRWNITLGELIAVLYEGYQCALAHDELGELAGLATSSTVQLLLATGRCRLAEFPVGHLAPRSLGGA
jgi:hypothetical protein